MRRILGEYQVTVNSVGEQDDHVDSLEDVGAEPGCDHRRPVRARVQTPSCLEAQVFQKINIVILREGVYNSIIDHRGKSGILKN